MEKIALNQSMTFYKVPSGHIWAAQNLRGLLTGIFTPGCWSPAYLLAQGCFCKMCMHLENIGFLPVLWVS